MVCDYGSTVILLHPYTGGAGASTVTLPAPQLNNIEHYNLKTSFGTAMSGDIYSYIKTPAVSKLTMSFVRLTLALKNEMILFLDTIGGDDIKLTDWLGNDWKGKISGNPVQFEEGINRYNLTLEFEGVPV